MRALLLLLAACGGASTAAPRPYVDTRAGTAGAPLLALAPQGADAVAELDVARLRANEVAAPLVAALVERRAASEEKVDLGFDALGDLDVAIAAVYRLGTDDAATLFLVRGDRLDAAAAATRMANAEAIDPITLAVGPPALRAEARQTAAGRTKSLRDDDELVRLRDGAMPTRASGAVLRVTARLSTQARIRAAGRLGVDELPATLSLWLDVADDAALVAWTTADNETQSRRLADAAVRLLERLAPRGEARAEPRARSARIVWTLGPRAFRRWAAETRDKLVMRK